MFIAIRAYSSSGPTFPSRTTYCSPCKFDVLFLLLLTDFDQDIKYSNMLVNHFYANTCLVSDYPEREVHEASPSARYCLCDFNISIMFPESSTSAERRLPADLSAWGAPWNAPADTLQGEFDYDPFAYDVGCLGTMLSRSLDVR